ncbi:MAG TPA: hypothetical protein VJ763_00590 [Sphingomicrobium sp.]|nr:hypothetical protein [Sphingomicrobium sp.]
MKMLTIVSSGYRATIEEQDDTIVWLTHCLRNAGADTDMLLLGAAANYPVSGQSIIPVCIGGREQRHSPEIHSQVAAFASNGSKVMVLSNDLEDRSIDRRRLLQQVVVVDSSDLPELLSAYDQVWHW